MRYLIFIVIVLLLEACSRHKSDENADKQSVSVKVAYVKHPDPHDSLCISDIELAKKDIKEGKIVFTQRVGFGFGNMRYEEELRGLCEANGLVFDVDLIGCVVFEGQTQGCYGNYMDEIIEEKFGPTFKKRLHAQADSMFLVNTNTKNRIVEYWYCDERPRLPNENERTDDYLPNVKALGIDIKGSSGRWPFFDVGFVVEKDSTLSNFHSNNFVAEAKENEKYRDQLFSVAVQYIQSEYPVWIPGKINGLPVCTDNNVRIFLTH